MSFHESKKNCTVLSRKKTQYMYQVYVQDGYSQAKGFESRWMSSWRRSFDSSTASYAQCSHRWRSVPRPPPDDSECLSYSTVYYLRFRVLHTCNRRINCKNYSEIILRYFAFQLVCSTTFVLVFDMPRQRRTVRKCGIAVRTQVRAGASVRVRVSRERLFRSKCGRAALPIARKCPLDCNQHIHNGSH